ncbi:MAG: DUF4298 domain-containing protein [Selenomonadaceae bacterium]|nr:DUF4298 domain-containing protein [Selenomonadaceae bacterium]
MVFAAKIVRISPTPSAKKLITGSQVWGTEKAGKIPKDLKRGVLSQDGVYDLLTKNRELQARLLEVLAEIVRNR